MNGDAANAILSQWGAFGGVLVVTWAALGFWIVRLQKSLDSLHESRAAELRATTDRILQVAEAQNETGQATAAAMQNVSNALQSIVQDLRDLREKGARR